MRKAFKCHCGKSYKTSQGLKNHCVVHQPDLLNLQTAQITLPSGPVTLPSLQMSLSSLQTGPLKSITTMNSASVPDSQNVTIHNSPVISLSMATSKKVVPTTQVTRAASIEEGAVTLVTASPLTIPQTTTIQLISQTPTVMPANYAPQVVSN